MRTRWLSDKSSSSGENPDQVWDIALLIKHFVAFSGVGLVGTLAHYLTLLLLVEGIGSGPSLGTGVGFVVGALVNYSLNYTYTFHSDARHNVALPKFLMIAAVGFCVNAIIIQVGVSRFAIHYLLVQLFATGVVLVWNFTGNLLWTFRGSHRGQ